MKLISQVMTFKPERLAESTAARSRKSERRLSLGFPSLAVALLASLWGSAGPLYAGCCEEGIRELLAEHISDYSAVGQTNLPGCLNTTTSLYEEFGDAGSWSRTWWKNTLAWEKDWKRTSLPGGADATFADARDFGYFCGHGNVGFVMFTTDMTDKFLVGSDTGFGDVDLEWVTFDSSKTLNTAAIGAWMNNAFTGGLHLLLGWHDSPLDGDTGGEFADEMIDWGFGDGGGDTISVAWTSSDGGCTDQASGTTQIILAEDPSHLKDHLHGQGYISPDSADDNVVSVFTHDC